MATEEMKKRKITKKDVQLYFILMGVFLGMALIAMLIMLRQVRHLWVECVNEPIATYSVAGTDWTSEDVETEDIKGNKAIEEEDTYFMLVKYNDNLYRVEVSEKAYDRAHDKKIKDFAAGEDAPSLYYDKLTDEVFQGWLHPDYFYFFCLVFLVVVGIFIYVPIKALCSGRQ